MVKSSKLKKTYNELGEEEISFKYHDHNLSTETFHGPCKLLRNNVKKFNRNLSQFSR